MCGFAPCFPKNFQKASLEFENSNKCLCYQWSQKDNHSVTKIDLNKSTLQGISKLSGQAKASTYPQVRLFKFQFTFFFFFKYLFVSVLKKLHFYRLLWSCFLQPEGTLGEAMSTYGNKLQDFDSEWEESPHPCYCESSPRQNSFVLPTLQMIAL